ncbi:MAG: hypothetical protein EA396_05800 [Anaerolineaceae bacterium]|nr:MAG: hypothetical protein EA396_05800 [Anaerolineaceae bacterium]
MGIFDVSVATVNADLVYLGLVFSLWIAVTAAYMPGTGVIEVVALGSFAGSIYVLAQLPTNWFFVMVIVLGGSAFMLVPFIHTRFAPFALGGLVLQGIGGLLLFTESISVSPLILVLSLIIPAAYHQFVLMPMLRNMKNDPAIDRDTNIIGMRGRVTRALDPVGTVYVNSEHWSAVTEEEENVEMGERVVVIGRENLRLIVEPLKRKRSPQPDELLDERE